MMYKQNNMNIVLYFQTDECSELLKVFKKSIQPPLL